MVTSTSKTAKSHTGIRGRAVAGAGALAHAGLDLVSGWRIVRSHVTSRAGILARPFVAGTTACWQDWSHASQSGRAGGSFRPLLRGRGHRSPSSPSSVAGLLRRAGAVISLRREDAMSLPTNYATTDGHDPQKGAIPHRRQGTPALAGRVSLFALPPRERGVPPRGVCPDCQSRMARMTWILTQRRGDAEVRRESQDGHPACL